MLDHVSRALARNTFWYGSVTVLGLAAGLIMSVLLARGLGPERMGDFSYASWILRLLETTATLGFGVATVRYTAKAQGRGEPQRAAGFFRLFLRWQLVSALILTAAVVPLVLALAPGDSRLAYLAAVATVLPVTMESIYMRGIYGAERYDITARISAVKMTLSLLATALALRLGGGVAGVLIAQGLVVCLSCGLQRHYARRLYSSAAAPLSRRDVTEARAFVVPLAAVMLLELLVWDRTEIFFLRLYVPSQELAFYSLAFGLAGRLIVFPNIIIGPLLPALAVLHGRDDSQQFARTYARAVCYAMLVGAPLIAVAAAVAPAVVALLYGAAYAPVAWMLRVLLAVMLVAVLREVSWAALQAAGARRLILCGSIGGTIIDLGLAILLIPRFGTTGAVVATSTAQVALSLWAVAATRWATGARLPMHALAKITGAAAAACAVTLTLSGPSFAVTALAVTAGAGTFVVSALALGLPGREEHAWARQFLARLVPHRGHASVSIPASTVRAKESRGTR